MTTRLQQAVQSLCDSSRAHSKPEQVWADLVQVGANYITERIFQLLAYPAQELSCSPLFRQELIHYKTDLKSWDALKEAFELLLEEFEQAEPFTDLLGAKMGSLLGSRLSQFLTPAPVAQAAAKFLAIDAKMPLSISDLAGCGTGGLVLGQLRNMLAKGQHADLLNVDVVINDLDPLLVKAACFQIVLYSCFHRIPIGSLTAYNLDVITEYGDKHLFFGWRPMSR